MRTNVWRQMWSQGLVLSSHSRQMARHQKPHSSVCQGLVIAGVSEKITQHSVCVIPPWFVKLIQSQTQWMIILWNNSEELTRWRSCLSGQSRGKQHFLLNGVLLDFCVWISSVSMQYFYWHEGHVCFYCFSCSTNICLYTALRSAEMSVTPDMSASAVVKVTPSVPG